MDSFTSDGYQKPEGWRKPQEPEESEEETDAEADAEAARRFLFPQCHGSFLEER